MLVWSVADTVIDVFFMLDILINFRTGYMSRGIFVRDARLILESELMSRATRAVIEARMARLNWRDGPPADRWAPIQILVSKDDTLRLAIYEGETDEYSLWIVSFDEQNNPVEVRRTPFIATDKTIDDVGVIV